MVFFGKKRRLIGLLGVLVVIPLVLLGGIGSRLARREREALRSRFDALLLGQLQAYRDRLARELETIELSLREDLGRPGLEIPQLRSATRRMPRVRQLFLLDARQNLLYPDARSTLTQIERDFLDRTQQIWKDRDLLQQDPPVEQAPATRTFQRAYSPAQKGAPPRQDRGWYVWYWGPGVNFIYYLRRPDGTILGAEVERTRILSELIASFPEIPPSPDEVLPEHRITMVDARGSPLHVWGRYTPPAGSRARVRLPLEAPLHPWSLEYRAPPEALEGGGSAFATLSLVSSGAAVAVVLFLVAGAIYREHGRELREAEQRVSFVNRVSHELKTPLTSIRMYAELLESELDEESDSARRHASVVISESQRLSRLISNVLTLAQKDRETLTLRRRPGCVDDIVGAVVAQFEPTLIGAGLRVQFRASAGGPVLVDPDVLIQILNNLVNNVEKYAASGGMLDVETSREGEVTHLLVKDGGPGIPVSVRERVFEPFFRLEETVASGPSGTGIGLSIVRELARLHGGDAWIDPAERGTVFHVTLSTPPADAGGGECAS